ncbi:MAG: DUF1761 domain-containing protein [Candidatus Dependentiae bacterium]|jgi:hypothetical protein
MFFAHLASFNLVGLLAGVVAHMLIGMLWYSPLLFGNAFIRASKLKASDIRMHSGHLIGAALIGFTVSLCLAYLNDAANIMTCRASIEHALLYWLAFVVTTQFSQVLWQKKSFELYLIEIGYWAVNLSVISCIVTRWA